MEIITEPNKILHKKLEVVPEITSEIKEVTALSMTPIGYSLQKAAEDLKPLKGKGTLGIVLVTDGQESCDVDPCKVAKEMIKSGLQLKVNVVGFDIQDQKAHDQLKCIAKATGGTYVTSNNADSLYKMLEKSVETVAKYDWNLRVNNRSSDGRVWKVSGRCDTGA